MAASQQFYVINEIPLITVRCLRLLVSLVSAYFYRVYIRLYLHGHIAFNAVKGHLKQGPLSMCMNSTIEYSAELDSRKDKKK